MGNEKARSTDVAFSDFRRSEACPSGEDIDRVIFPREPPPVVRIDPIDFRLWS